MMLAGRRVAHLLGTMSLMLGMCAATAVAANRFASPVGSGTACTVQSPCDIVTAVNQAGAGDDVTIEPGTYGSPSAPLTTELAPSTSPVTIHGEAGQPRPVIDTSAFNGFGVGDQVSLSDVDVEDSSSQLRASAIFVYGHSGTADHVVAHATGTDDMFGCKVVGQLVDSVCWGSAPNGSGAWVEDYGPASQVAFFHNDTLIGSGTGGYGALVSSSSGWTAQMNVSNTIIRGSAEDVFADAGPGGTTIFQADYSDYAAVASTGSSTVTPAGSLHNQSAAPRFVDAATGDFTELASSPTVDAGVDDPLDDGSTDLAGNPRELGVHTDIGAYEFVSPPFCSNLSAATGFGKATVIALSCQDLLATPVTYALLSTPGHGTASLNAVSGAVTYTPSPGFSGPDSFTYTATNSHGTAQTSTVTIAVAPEPAPGLAHVHGGHAGFTFSLAEPATVTFVFTQRLSGRRVHHTCVAQTHANRHEPACVRTVTRGRLVVAGTAGTNTVQFTGRLSHGRILPAGRYVVSVTAVNAGGTSTTTRFALTLRRS